MGFWKNVEIEREYRGISRKELASKANINYASIGMGLERDSVPVADTALRIAKALNVSIEYLLTGAETDLKTGNGVYNIMKKFLDYNSTINNLDLLPNATRESIMKMIEAIANDIQ